MNPFDDYAVLVLCAGDVDAIWGALNYAGKPNGNPVLPAPGAPDTAYVTTQYWDVLGQMRCDDLFIADQQNCYYGLLLRCKAAFGPFKIGNYLVAMRGTMDPLEWANDAMAEFPEYQSGVMGGVGTGFWNVYATMSFGDLANAHPKPHAAVEIASVIKAAPAPVFVTGHSLGAALATYLTRDLLVQFVGTNISVTPYFFASPKIGTQDYVDNYQQAVGTYTLVNFAADLVPMLPSSPPFMALNGGGPTHDVHIIPINSPGAPPFPPVDPMFNHHTAYYAHMLDPTNTMATKLLPK
jgi:Lipase (class 3)